MSEKSAHENNHILTLVWTPTSDILSKHEIGIKYLRFFSWFNTSDLESRPWDLTFSPTWFIPDFRQWLLTYRLAPLLFISNTRYFSLVCLFFKAYTNYCVGHPVVYKPITNYSLLKVGTHSSLCIVYWFVCNNNKEASEILWIPYFSRSRYYGSYSERHEENLFTVDGLLSVAFPTFRLHALPGNWIH